jgi:alginate O-acetyltransferase complex protein AlgJ
MMFKFPLTTGLQRFLIAGLLAVTPGHAENQTPVIIGTDSWLFTSYEVANASDAKDTEASLQLIARMNQLFEQRGIALALVIVPSKVRIYADKLPNAALLDRYTADKYDVLVKRLTEAGVKVVNLNQAFLKNEKRNSDTPLFLRLDTHWSPSGALLAAETIKATIDSTPTLNDAWSKTVEEKHTLSWAKQKTVHRARDLIKFLPKDAAPYAPEQVLQFAVSRQQTSQADLLSEADDVKIVAIGSSYSDKNTGYPDALRYTLQRNILDISIPALQGPWVGMESYLRDEAFTNQKPNLVIWEIPEREFRSPPDYKFREARYIVGNEEWLARVTALFMPN